MRPKKKQSGFFESIKHIFNTKLQIKIFFLALASIIVTFVLIYTNVIVNQLIEREKTGIKLYADLYQHLDPVNNTDDLIFLVEKFSPTINFPLIMTIDGEVPYPFIKQISNIDLDTSKSIEWQRQYLQDYIKNMDAVYKPFEVKIKTDFGIIITKFHYTNSKLIDQLQLFPLIEIGIVGLFIFLGYLSFSSIKRNEESKVWVGMAKEAAHQLGTPLSSLLAWMEILKFNKEEPELIEDTVTEMQKDIDRLNMIAIRFSKIGSLPEIKMENISYEIENICKYFEKRLPVLGKKIEICRTLPENIYCPLNAELFAWVIENLLKNAAEAIEDKNGSITIVLIKTFKKTIITVADTGKGMSKKQKRQVFFPGYTTKQRGWGLGLSLSKRIIQEYHKGKIYVKESMINKGTTFLIELPDSDNFDYEEWTISNDLVSDVNSANNSFE